MPKRGKRLGHTDGTVWPCRIIGMSMRGNVGFESFDVLLKREMRGALLPFLSLGDREKNFKALQVPDTHGLGKRAHSWCAGSLD